MRHELDLGELGLDRGGHLLVKAALARLPPGAELRVCGRAPALAIHLRAWSRGQGHGYRDAPAPAVGIIARGDADHSRLRGAERAGLPDPAVAGAVRQRPSARWGLAARGAAVEAGAPAFEFGLVDKDEVWTDDAGRLYAQAAAAQWDPGSAIPWDAEFELPEVVEDAVVQVMTYLVENETAALIVPARFASRVHPHFREIMQLLALQAAEEARHIEVFTRRATLRRDALGLSSASGQASLKTLLDEPDFALAAFLLSVMGEGTFLTLLRFLHRHAPDPVTRRVMQLTARDEARHVAFGLGHLKRHAARDPSLLDRLAAATRRRHDALANTAGLNEEVFDALVILAAGQWRPDAIGRGFEAVVELQREMDEGRRRRLERLGFSRERAVELSSLHTRNFM